MRSWGRWFWVIFSSAVVVAAAGAPFWLSEETAAPAAAEEPARVSRVRPEMQYYVLLTVIEAEPHDEDGESWDKRNGAPDIAYEIHWQGQRIFESSKKSDTLVAKWSNVAIKLTDLIKEGISIDDSIKAARITVRRGDKLEFGVYDKDPLSDDLIGKWSVSVESLRVGDQKWTKPGDRVLSAVCRVLPLDPDARELVR